MLLNSLYVFFLWRFSLVVYLVITFDYKLLGLSREREGGKEGRREGGREGRDESKGDSLS
jgi:hypothetical protein